MNVELHIDTLVLDGVYLPPEQQPVLQQALEAELARLLGKSGLGTAATRQSAVARLAAGKLSWAKGGSPVVLGQRIAQRVFEGINRRADPVPRLP